MLSRSLPIWLDNLDTLTIVTRNGDEDVQRLYDRYSHRSCIKLVTTDVFTAYGASFNKAAALCEAYGVMAPTDWVLHFDSDIIPPKDWRQRIHLHFGHLYGAFRYSEEGECLDEKPLYPYGYLHLWNVADRHAWQWPLFQLFHPHAGNYDSHFADQWPQKCRLNLGFTVIHQGEPRQCWFGENAKEEMDYLHSIGLQKVRGLAAEGIGVINLPEPRQRVYIEAATDNPDRTVKILNYCASKGPFAIQASIYPTSFASLLHVSVPTSLSLTDVKELLDVRDC